MLSAILYCISRFIVSLVWNVETDWRLISTFQLRQRTSIALDICVLSIQDHIFKLMKNDSYSRYIRSDMYKEFLQGSKKKVISRFYVLQFVNV